MDYTYLHHQIGLTLLHNVGPVRARHLLELLGGIEPLFQLNNSELQAITGYKRSFFLGMKRDEALAESDRTINHLYKNDIRPSFYTDSTYPRRLGNCQDAPLMLYQKGALDLNDKQWVSVVGTRASTNYGKSIVQDLIESFRDRDIVVVSGLALGIDGYVHNYCLDYNVPTVAVLGHGLDRVYPYRHRGLSKRIEEHGSLITEFIPGTNPDRENFPKRNRIVAGMCDATIVVESKRRGGSLITADLANGYNRDVFAFPGSVYEETSAGCHELIKNDLAHLIQTPTDFLRYMDWNEGDKKKSPAQSKLFVELTDEQKLIVDAIRAKPIHIDVLSGRVEKPISELNVSLTILEMDGVIQQLPGKLYSVC